MCPGIPGKVVEVLDGYAGQLPLVPPAPETRVLLHVGLALETVDEVAATEATNSVEMMGRERDV